MKFYLIFLLFCLFSCSKSNKQASTVLPQWIGKEILYPNNMVFTIQGDEPVRIITRDDSVYVADNRKCINMTGKLAPYLVIEKARKLLNEDDCREIAGMMYYTDEGQNMVLLKINMQQI